MIRIEGLTKSYNKVLAIDNVSLQFERGQSISLLGPNGSGKTTLIKSILGLVIPEKGAITINNEVINGKYQYRSQIGYMPQIGRYPENMTIKQVINMLKELRTDCKTYDEELIKAFDLPAFQHKTMRSLSGGTRQKVSVCLAFLFTPEIFIMDEPTAGLDPLSSELLKDKIAKERENGKLILITSHVMSDLDEITSHIVYLQDGKLLFYKSMEELRKITEEEKLNKIIASIIRNEYTNDHNKLLTN